jgi:hypothetical protein
VRAEITFAGLSEQDGKVVATFDDPTPGQEYALEVHAIDRAGTAHRGNSPNGAVVDMAAKSRSMKFEFEIPLAEIQSLRPTYRRYETVEVRNLAMTRGVPSDVRLTIHPPATQPATAPAPAAAAATR